MLQADPFIQSPTNSQSLNRYSYVLNNPLSYTDPSGYFASELFNFARAFVRVWASEGFDAAAWGDLLTSAVALINAFSGQGVLAPGIALGSVAGPVFSLSFGQRNSKSAQEIEEAFRDPRTATIGGTVSEITDDKFGNGAVTETFSKVLNDEVHDRRQHELETARADGEARVGPYLSGYDSNDPNYHRYTVGPTQLCTLGEDVCSAAMATQITGSESVPFIFGYSGSGSYNLPYGMGLDPIDHLTPQEGVWMNVTQEGHRYHPGSVAHALYPSSGKLWLYTIGAGVGPNAAWNVRIEKPLFRGMHFDVRIRVLQQQYGLDAHSGPWE